MVQADQVLPRRNQKDLIGKRYTGCAPGFDHESISQLAGNNRIFMIVRYPNILICFIKCDTVSASCRLQVLLYRRDICQALISPLSRCVKWREFLRILPFSGNPAKHDERSVFLYDRMGRRYAVIITCRRERPDRLAVPVQYHTPWCFRRRHANDNLVGVKRINGCVYSCIKLAGFCQLVLFIRSQSRCGNQQ